MENQGHISTSRPHIVPQEPTSLRRIGPSQPEAVTEWPALLDEERYALGACFCGQAVEATQLLQADDFSLRAHREIFAAICALVADGEPALEEPLVAGELARRGQLDAVGGMTYLCDLADGVVTARRMESRAKRLHEFAERRRLLSASADLERRARNLACSVSETKVWLREVAQ
jgi:replicative DNA helicase